MSGTEALHSAEAEGLRAGFGAAVKTIPRYAPPIHAAASPKRDRKPAEIAAPTGSAVATYTHAGDVIAPPRVRRIPVPYTKDLADEIVALVASGRSLLDICNNEPGMPSEAGFRSWVVADRDGLAARYARAREARAEIIAEQALAAALTATDAALGRLAYDARRWFASKLDPKVYGDRVKVDVVDDRPADQRTDAELLQIVAAAEMDGVAVDKADAPLPIAA